MHDLAHFRFDEFISYGWAGIQRKEDADRGWVDEFKRRLTGELSGELGREARIYLDVEQSQNGELPANLTEAVQSSVLFLAVVSPGSVRVDSWCHFELAKFIEHDAGLLKDLKQVFVARIRNVAPAQWPEPIRKIIPYDFLGDDPRHKMLPEEDLAYAGTAAGGLVQSLAIDLAKTSRIVEQQIAHTVFLPYTDPSLVAQAERLATEIDTRGGAVIRGSYQAGESESAFVDRTAREVRRAGISVHLLGAGAAPRPEGWSDSIQGLQIRTAGERFQAERNHMIVWHASRDAQTAGPELQWAEVLKGTGFEYMESLLRDMFSRNIVAASTITGPQQELAKSASASGDSAPGISRPVLSKLLYVECVPQDLAKLQAFRLRLESRGIRIKPPLFDGDEATRKRLNEEFLQRCAGVVVYFGSRNDLEAFVACQSLWDALQKYHLNMPRAVLLDPADDPVRSFFFYPEFENYPSTQLDAFVERAFGRGL